MNLPQRSGRIKKPQIENKDPMQENNSSPENNGNFGFHSEVDESQTTPQGSKGLRDCHHRHKKTKDYRRKPKFTQPRAARF